MSMSLDKKQLRHKINNLQSYYQIDVEKTFKLC